MTNKLIKNETEVYYTIEVNENVVVTSAEFSYGDVRKVEVRRKEDRTGQGFSKKEPALKVAQYVSGKVIKHTRTEVITEVIEEENK